MKDDMSHYSQNEFKNDIKLMSHGKLNTTNRLRLSRADYTYLCWIPYHGHPI